MKKVALLGVALGLSAVFASCGLIPPIKVDNPIGLSGAVLSAPLAATGASLRPQVAGVGTATASATFADLTTSIPFTPSSFNVQLAIASATITGCEVTTSSSTTVTVSNMAVSLSDGSGQTVRNVSATLPTFTFKLSGAGVISELNTSALLFGLGANVAPAMAIVQTAPTPNSVSVTANVATSPALPGCTLSFTFGAGSGEIKL
jgi:hypothetical protein